MPAAGLDGAQNQPPGPKMRGARRIVLRVTAVLAALLALVLAASLAAGLELSRMDSGPEAAWARSSGHDALWMGRIWAQGEYTPAQFAQMTARLRDSGLSDVYVFVGQMSADGHLDPGKYADARSFLAAFGKALPRVRVSAWMSGVLGSGNISLASAATRDQITASASAVLRTGFSGIHYDLEPVPSGDQGYLQLLQATSELRPRPEPLSVSVPKLEPLPALRFSWQLAHVGPVFWTQAYLTAVSQHVDQVDLMAYDTTMPFPSWYGGYVAQQTGLALRAVPSRVQLLIGIPCYHYTNFAHRASAETVAAALRGVRVALTANDARGRGVGVALFADYSSTPQDWQSYVSGWVRPGPAPS
jgi:hypothetical protein